MGPENAVDDAAPQLAFNPGSHWQAVGSASHSGFTSQGPMTQK
jgi:hypothetical protein